MPRSHFKGAVPCFSSLTINAWTTVRRHSDTTGSHQPVASEVRGPLPGCCQVTAVQCGLRLFQKEACSWLAAIPDSAPRAGAGRRFVGSFVGS